MASGLPRRRPVQEPLDEVRLAREAAAGDAGAFRGIVERYHRMVYGICHRRVDDPERAMELTQDVFLRVHRGIPGFQGECSLGAWIARIAIHRCQDEWRSAARRLRRLFRPIEAALAVPMAEPAPDLRLVARQRDALVHQLIEELPKALREPFLLRHEGNLEYAEIAAVLGLREGAVRMRVCRARERLLRRLEEEDGG